MAEKLTAKDYASGAEVRWCPGCGDHAIVRSVQKLLADEGAKKHETAFISGIGCAARFPYYMNTYGFHTIHGRAPTFGVGAKLANPDLDVWIMGGDGDFLSIGGNHFIHMIRRNLDVTCILFNNQIYGLTKGQASPTSEPGKKTPSTPFGVIDNPANALALALGAGANFVARTLSEKPKELLHDLKSARGFEGTAFVEVLQTCSVFNMHAFDQISDRKTGDDYRIRAEHGKPLLFGLKKEKGLRFNPSSCQMEVVHLDQDGITIDDVLVHDETNRTLAEILVRLDNPEFPKVFGRIYANPQSKAWDKHFEQNYQQHEQKNLQDFFDFLATDSWEVK